MMDDVRGDVLGPSHGTTPAVEIANKLQRWDPLDAKVILNSNHVVNANKYVYLTVTV